MDTLGAAADGAKRRLQRIKTQIRALEKAGGTEDAAKLKKLQKDAETAEKRLTGFQQRHEKLKQRLTGGEAEKTSSPKAAASAD